MPDIMAVKGLHWLGYTVWDSLCHILRRSSQFKPPQFKRRIINLKMVLDPAFSLAFMLLNVHGGGMTY